MNNSGTPTGANGKKELKVTKSNDVENLLEKYFEDLREEGYGKIEVRALAFDVPEVALKSKAGDNNERTSSFGNIINVINNGKREMELEELMNGLAMPIKLANLKKVKAKADELRKDEKTKKSVDGTEKPEDDRNK